jgi:hypothetical protein
MYIYCVYPEIPKCQKQLSNCLKRAETTIVLIVFNGVLCDLHAYTVTIFLPNINMNQVPERLY